MPASSEGMGFAYFSVPSGSGKERYSVTDKIFATLRSALKPLVMLALCVPVYADDITLTCTPPTQNTDGTEIPATGDLALASFRLYVPATNAPYALLDEQPECAFTVVRDVPGTYTFVATAVNNAGAESDYSEPATKTIEAPPQPPTGLTVQANSIAYTLQQIDDGLTLYATAIVREDTPCNPNISIRTANYPNGVYLIPKASVDFPPGVDARTLYAECAGG